MTIGLTVLSIVTMKLNYINTEDPTLGFISKGTTIIGREMARNKVDHGWYYGWKHKYFYNSPRDAERNKNPPSYRRKLKEGERSRDLREVSIRESRRMGHITTSQDGDK